VAALVAVILVALGAGGYFAYKKYSQKRAEQTEAGSGQPQVSQPVPGAAAPGTLSQPGAAPTLSYQEPASTGSSGTGLTPGYGKKTSSTQGSSGSYQPPVLLTPSGSSASVQQQQQPAPETVPPPAVEQPAPAPPPAMKHVEILKPPPAEQAPAAAPAVYSGPPSGLLVWIGRLEKNGSVTIDGRSASMGSLTGALPGVPVIIDINQREFALAETPGPSNGWRRLVLRSRSKRHSVVSIKWTVIR
jgi:hypothetical protein